MCQEKDHLLPFSTEGWWHVRRGWIKEREEKRKIPHVLAGRRKVHQPINQLRLFINFRAYWERI